MKRIGMLVVGGMLVTTSAWAESRCKVYEYAELKDMTDVELQAEMDKTSNEELAQYKLGNKMTELGAYRIGDRAYGESRGCSEQYSRLASVKHKRANPVTPATP